MSHHTETPTTSPDFSVVIPCFNEQASIGQLLGDLAQQTERPAAIVVADCASEDATVQVAEQFTDRLPLRIVQSSGRSPAAARNSGVSVLDCRPKDYLVFVDADMRLPADFLERMKAVVLEHPVNFITPEFRSDGKHRADTAAIRQINAYNNRIITRKRKVAGIGGTMIVRKFIHDSVGGFPEDVAQDDMAYVDRLNKAGATAYYATGIYAINSSRRLREEGMLQWLLGVVPEGTLVAKGLSRILGRNVTERAYGHYTKHKS